MAVYDVVIKARRYRCPKCGSIYREPIRGLKSNKRISENAKDEIIDKYLDGATNKKISKRLGVSQSTVERVIHERFELKVKEQLSYECPSIIGIDEHTIHKGYKFATTICELLNRKHQTAKECKRNIRELKTMMKQMKYEATQEFERLAETISDWFAPIIRMWRFTKNNGITEGFHRKMKLIQRMAYGYKNFENYRLRVLVLCGVFH